MFAEHVGLVPYNFELWTDARVPSASDFKVWSDESWLLWLAKASVELASDTIS